MEVVAPQRIRDAIGPLDLVDAMRDTFVAISEGRVRATFSLLDLDDGDVHIKASSEVGGELYTVKLASWVASNRERGLPAAGGAVLVCSSRTGAPIAVLVDEHHLTDARTAAAGALASDLLAMPRAASVAVLGNGTQARLQVVTLAALRRLERVVVWARRATAAHAMVSDLEAALGGVEVSVADTPREAVEVGDIVVTATASREPLVDARWLLPGTHVTAVGADDGSKRELSVGCFSRADRIAVDSRAQTCATAELAQALSEGAVRHEDIVELGDVIAGRADRRGSDEEITIAKLTGVAAQDLAAAKIVVARLGLPT